MALFFSGTMRTASAATVAPTTSLSCAVWCRHGDAFSGSMRIFDWGSSQVALLPTGAADDYVFQRAWTTLGDWTFTLATAGLDRRYWHFIGITYDGSSTSNNPTIYCAQEGDTSLATVGSFVSSTAPTGTINNTAATIHIGNRADGIRPYIGEIAWTTFYDAVLTSDQMLQVAINGYITDNLLRGYELISTTGASSEQDLSANNGDATPNNTPIRVPEPLRLLPPVKFPGTSFPQFPKSKLRRAA